MGNALETEQGTSKTTLDEWEEDRKMIDFTDELRSKISTTDLEELYMNEKWEGALVVKVLGRRVSYPVLEWDANQVESVEGDVAAKESKREQRRSEAGCGKEQASPDIGDAEMRGAKATFGPWCRETKVSSASGARGAFQGEESAENGRKEISGNTGRENHGTDKLLLFNAVKEANKKERASIRGVTRARWAEQQARPELLGRVTAQAVQANEEIKTT
ncbi:hypothetical protein CRG98_001151 [Punica granatum]|uniref:DUF4283 domain-containing protein n=1 Tax=Punica granatum TaxID=22663 RepID=A0A2I0LCN8_PUNGR|nr:hypothetical protein CRG98_001151 [Punica granatum]